MYFQDDEYIAQTIQNELNLFQNLDDRIKCVEKENKNLVDSDLEFIDPTPSIHDLFVRLNEKFFWGVLGMVEVKWSNRMTQCAGLCYFEGKQGFCKICLSAPLLSLRPRKDLVETLLHEMIHAYLFVTNNFKDREDHGPQFHSHMFRINKQAGTNITVYHTFHDEVEFYKRHIWRCDGPCRLQKPYFGFVRRSMNRAPGPSDNWWKQHQAHCSGTFIKISEPEQKSKISRTNSKSQARKKLNDIRTFFKSESPTRSLSTKKNLITPTNGGIAKPKKEVKSIIFSNLINIQVNSKTTNLSKDTQNLLMKIPDKYDFTQIQNDSSTSKSSQGEESAQKCKVNKSKDSEVDVREVVRSVWINKFYSKYEGSEEPVSKKIKINCSMCEERLSELGCDAHLNSCLSTHKKSMEKGINEAFKTTSSKKEQEIEELKNCPICNKEILKPEMNDHLENCVSCKFVNDENSEDLEDEILCQSLPCPCCYKWFLESQMNNHLDECLTLIALNEGLLNP